MASTDSTIVDWTAEECAEFVIDLGLKQYYNTFLDNEIDGEALIALKHDELKEMGITSVGHRLTILKNVYETKRVQGLPIDQDHYIPMSAEDDHETATQDDIARIVQSIKLRDERIMAAEAELRKLAEDYRKLREEVLPVVKVAKDRSQPLPFDPPGHPYSGVTDHISDATTMNEKQVPVTRTYSKKAFTGAVTPKANSPTHIPPSVLETRTYHDGSTLDPSTAAIAVSSHLTASMSGGGQPSPNSTIPSPTSPGNFYQHPTLGPRSYSRDNISNHTYDYLGDAAMRDRVQSGVNQAGRSDPPSSGGRSNDPSSHSVEIFKSFRVSMDDPCYRVLPAALRKYNIHEDWRLYALYIVYGGEERCLGLDERPLILFKQLDKEGRKPMFMLRKQATPTIDGSGVYSGMSGNGTFGSDGSAVPPGNAPVNAPPGSGGLRQHPSAIQLPGGVF